jgi:hypothetical protein
VQKSLHFVSFERSFWDRANAIPTPWQNHARLAESRVISADRNGVLFNFEKRLFSIEQFLRSNFGISAEVQRRFVARSAELEAATARAVIAKFGDIPRPPSNARGSDWSHYREGVVSSYETAR